MDLIESAGDWDEGISFLSIFGGVAGVGDKIASCLFLAVDSPIGDFITVLSSMLSFFTPRNLVDLAFRLDSDALPQYTCPSLLFGGSGSLIGI